MAKFRLRVSGWRGYEVACGSDIKTRVVFGVFDEDKTTLAWYLFASLPANCGTGAKVVDKQFGHHDEIGGHNPINSDHPIAPEKLLAHPDGTPAQLDIDAEDRHMNCDIKDLKTSAKDTVSFGATLLKDHKPGTTEKIKGTVELLEFGTFSPKNFKLGPQKSSSQSKITGPVI